jgi:hypothetical protein
MLWTTELCAAPQGLYHSKHGHYLGHCPAPSGCRNKLLRKPHLFTSSGIRPFVKTLENVQNFFSRLNSSQMSRASSQSWLRDHTHTLTHGIPHPLGHKTHKRQETHAPAGFERGTPASEWLQTHALDCATTGINKCPKHLSFVLQRRCPTMT